MNQSQTLQVLFAIIMIAIAVETKPSKKHERAKLPSFVKICHRSDPLLNTCTKNSLKSLREYFKVGIPEMFIPPLEPLVIPEMKLNQDSGAIYMHATFKDVQIHGLSNFTINDVNVDTKNLKLSMSMSFPNITLKAKYSIKGKIMMMPLMGDGDFNSNFTSVKLTSVIVAQRYKKKDSTFIKVKDVQMNYNIGTAKLHLDNLFNGDNALGNRMNTFINENWESLSDDIRPLMENAIADVVRSSTDKLFETYSYDDLLPE